MTYSLLAFSLDSNIGTTGLHLCFLAWVCAGSGNDPLGDVRNGSGSANRNNIAEFCKYVHEGIIQTPPPKAPQISVRSEGRFAWDGSVIVLSLYFRRSVKSRVAIFGGFGKPGCIHPCLHGVLFCAWHTKYEVFSQTSLFLFLYVIQGVTCLGRCKGEQECATRCFAQYGSSKLDSWLTCTLEVCTC